MAFDVVSVNKPSKKSFFNKKNVIRIVIILAVAGALAFLTWQYFELRKENERLSDPQAAAQEETNRLVEEVGKLIELPSEETPTVATVVDVEKLKEQPFFAKAKNQDRVLIYTESRKAILYRPETKKIIEVAPINIGNNQGNQQSQNTDSESTEQDQ